MGHLDFRQVKGGIKLFWNFFAWVGIATLTALALWTLYGMAESFIVARIGWTRLYKLGFWRALKQAATMRKFAGEQGGIAKDKVGFAGETGDEQGLR